MFRSIWLNYPLSVVNQHVRHILQRFINLFCNKNSRYMTRESAKCFWPHSLHFRVTFETLFVQIGNENTWCVSGRPSKNKTNFLNSTCQCEVHFMVANWCDRLQFHRFTSPLLCCLVQMFTWILWSECQKQPRRHWTVFTGMNVYTPQAPAKKSFPTM